MDGLQALLHDPGQEMGSKMAEVSNLVGQMQELQLLAQRHQEVVASGRASASAGGDGAANGTSHGAADAGEAPRRPAAGPDGGLGMGGLDTVDLDGLLQSLEGRGRAGLEDPD